MKYEIPATVSQVKNIALTPPKELLQSDRAMTLETMIANLTKLLKDYPHTAKQPVAIMSPDEYKNKASGFTPNAILLINNPDEIIGKF